MLHALRRGAKTWAAKLLLVLLVFSFGIWGISSYVGGFGGTAVVTVGDEEIDARAFQLAYQSEVNAIQRQTQTAITPEMAQLFGIPQRVISGLAANATFDGITKQLNLGISEERLADRIRERYAPSGVFDRAQLASLLRENGMTETEFVNDERDAATRSQLLDGLSGGMQAPDIYVDAFYDFQNEQRSIRYVPIGADDVADPGQPSDDELSDYFAENQANYRAPEYRAIRIIAVDPSKIADESAVSEDEIRAEYDRAESRFKTVERRQVFQLLTGSLEEAEAAAGKLASGASFEDIVAESGKTMTDVDLGVVPRSEILDPAIAEAAFELEAGETSAAIDARFGGAIVKVTDIEESVQTPLKEVMPALRQELAIARSEEDVLDLYDEIEDARAGGATFEEIAERFSLELITTPPVSRAGADEEGQMIAETIPGGDQVIAGAFDSDIGLEADPIEIGNNAFAWFEVDDVVVARDQTLDEVRERAIADWRADQIARAEDDLADKIAVNLQTGSSLSDLAAEYQLEIVSAGPFTRSAEPPEGLSPSALLETFDGPKDHVAVSDTSDGRRMVLVVDEVVKPAFFGEAAGNEEIRQSLENGLENGLINRFVQIEQDTLGVQVNQTLLNQLLNPQDAPTIR